MARDASVLEDGVETATSTTPGPGPWIWLIVGVALGVAAGALWFNSPTPSVTQGPIQPAGPLQIEEAPEEAEPAGLGEIVDGFPDTLVAVTHAQNRGPNLEHLTWPLAGPPESTPLSGSDGDLVRFDAAGRQLAVGTSMADATGLLLSVGRSQQMTPLTSDVTSFAWHDSEPGRLSYTKVVDGEWLLWSVDGSMEPQLITRGIMIDGEIAAWGSWGWAVQNDPDTFSTFTPSGGLQSMLDGKVLDSRSSGWILVDNDGLQIVFPGGEVRDLAIPTMSTGTAEVGKMSPDGTRVAVINGASLLVADLDVMGEVIEAPVAAGTPQLTWTSDSRFLISPWMRGVLIMDIDRSGRSYSDLISQGVVAVGTVPLADR